MTASACRLPRPYSGASRSSTMIFPEFDERDLTEAVVIETVCYWFL